MLCTALCLLLPAPQDHVLFDTHVLSDEFYAEGAHFADLDRDGAHDVIVGPFWFAGPDFRERHRYRAGEPFDRAGYSDHFFTWPVDLDGDGWLDLLMVGFPGAESFWYENPGGGEGMWARHLVHDNVDNESPAYVDIVGDEARELVFHTGGRLVWAAPGADPRAPWDLHVLSTTTQRGRFTHGLGVGDVNGDGRKDVLLNEGWWEQPAELAGDPLWAPHPFQFSKGQGGAQMLVSDVDGDGDGDVITSLNAHRYGLSWFENDGTSFIEHPIMGTPDDALADGWAVSELHALDLCDVDGDGLDDFVTGKRYMSHGLSEAGARDPAHILWFRCVRADGAVRFEPRGIHDASGVGTQVIAGDVNGDGRVDFVSASKKGAFVHLQRAERGARPAREEREDERFPPHAIRPVGSDGRVLNLDFETGDLTDWSVSGAAFAQQPIEGDTVHPRRADSISHHAGRFWIGGYERLGDAPQGRLVSAEFELTAPFVTFLVGGGAALETRVELVRATDGKVLARVSGENREELLPVVVDLSAHVGEALRIELVDEHTGGWGHLNFDHFRLYAERPQFAAGVELATAQRDVVANDGLAPAEAARAMDVPAGFHVELIAAEPDIHQPIAFAIDARSRLWIAEAYSYPIRRPDDEARDRIVILEDADGDGTFETRKVFVEGLNLVSGLEVGFGGVWVGAAPYLYFIPDRDGDDVPDGAPEVLLDGWGHQDTHETLNAFIWGPDGWLYGCHGVFTHSNVGKPGTPDDERVKLNAGVWRYHPTRHEFEVFAWGTSNPWGVDFDDHGEAFVTACVIPHLFHLSQGGRYQRQAGAHFNPYVFDDIKTIADHAHFVGETPHGGNGRSDSVGGGHAHCGLMIYLGDAFPQEDWRGALFFNNVHGNRVNVDRLEPAGSGFVGKHGDDFLLANDLWFRGINLKYGPSGEVYLIDWYDPRACHGTDPEVWDRSNGRVYRVTYEGTETRPVDLRLVQAGELARLQMHDNDWYVRTGRRLLQERGLSRDDVAYLTGELLTHADVTKRLRAMWALHVGGAFTPELAAQLPPDDHLTAWAIRLLLERGGGGLERLAGLALDAGPVTRRALASGLQRMPLEKRWAPAARLVRLADVADDVNIPLLVWYGVEPLVALDPRRALRELARPCALERVRAFIHRRAASDEEGRLALFEELAATQDTAYVRDALQDVITALGDRRGLALPASWPQLYARLAQSADADVRERALIIAATFGDPQAFPALRARLADALAPRAERERALDALERARDAEAVPIIVALLDEDALRGPALRALAGFADPRAARGILERWSRFDAEQRTDAVATLTSRVDSALPLLRAMQDGAVEPALLTAFDVRKLRTHGDERVNALVTTVWGNVRDVAEDAAAQIASWKERLTDERLARADLAQGRAVFARTCQRCHSLYGVGEAIGPDITGSNRADLDYLLTNMVDPSAEVPKEYRMTVVATTDGRVVNGILQRETADAIVLRTENDVVTLATDEVDARKLDENSMMPAGQLDTLSEDEVGALVAYLRHDAQVPQRMTADDLAAFFDGATLARWSGDAELWSVEDGVLVGRSPGLDRNAFLVSDWDLGDFRLVLDVKLTPAAGNSGVQFRSRATEDGDVAGYQADIGGGWWGTLYDEHGRGALVSGPRDDLVREWNTYEVLAVGDRIQTALNGTRCVDFTDSEPRARGVVALQLHSGGAFEVRFRDLRLELDPEPWLSSVR